MMVPETLLTHRNPRAVSFARKKPTSPLRTNHHMAEPKEHARDEHCRGEADVRLSGPHASEYCGEGEDRRGVRERQEERRGVVAK